MTEKVDVQAAGAMLRSYAEHFVQDEWRWSRENHIEAIRYDYPEDRLLARIKNAGHWLFGHSDFARLFHETWHGRFINRFVMAAYVLERDKHLPDGVLNGGNIIVHWEETGEYIQMVQPLVGSKIADFLEQDPENPHAIAIAEEISRVFGGVDTDLADWTAEVQDRINANLGVTNSGLTPGK